MAMLLEQHYLCDDIGSSCSQCLIKYLLNSKLKGLRVRPKPFYIVAMQQVTVGDPGFLSERSCHDLLDTEVLP